MPIKGNQKLQSDYSRTRFAGNCARFIVLIIVGVFITACADKQAAQKRIIENEFTLEVKNLAGQVDARISNMKLIAKTVANDTHIHAWVDDGFNEAGESLLVDKLGFLVKEYGLTSASFADKNTNKYWNHEGFLRELTPEIDTWYFAYLKSGNQDLVSVYHDKNNNRVDVYVNYQQTDGNGLSGIATSFNGVLDTLNTSSLAKHGDIYLVDKAGKVQVHVNSEVAGNETVQSLFDDSVAQELIAHPTIKTTVYIKSNEAILGSRYIPSMGWFLVVSVDHDGFLTGS
jgi:hypothetical protein